MNKVVEPLASSLEEETDDVLRRHGLRDMHFFAREGVWRVFGSRGTEAFKQSVEEGRGKTIAAALRNLDERLIAGPINRGPLPPWEEPALQATNGSGS